MTPEQAKKLLPIIQAFAEGKVIQYRHPASTKGEWVVADYPSFTQAYEWRVKPEPLKAWVVALETDQGIVFVALSNKPHQDEFRSTVLAIQEITIKEGEGL